MIDKPTAAAGTSSTLKGHQTQFRRRDALTAPRRWLDLVPWPTAAFDGRSVFGTDAAPGWTTVAYP